MSDFAGDVDLQVDELGDSVTLRVISEDNYNSRGDVNESSSPTDIVTIAIPNTLRSEESEVREGLFQVGDKRFFFKTDQSNLTNRNRIYHEGLWYQIVEVLKHRLQDQVVGVEVLARKI